MRIDVGDKGVDCRCDGSHFGTDSGLIDIFVFVLSLVISLFALQDLSDDSFCDVFNAFCGTFATLLLCFDGRQSSDVKSSGALTLSLGVVLLLVGGLEMATDDEFGTFLLPELVVVDDIDAIALCFDVSLMRIHITTVGF